MKRGAFSGFFESAHLVDSWGRHIYFRPTGNGWYLSLFPNTHEETNSHIETPVAKLRELRAWCDRMIELAEADEP